LVLFDAKYVPSALIGKKYYTCMCKYWHLLQVTDFLILMTQIVTNS